MKFPLFISALLFPAFAQASIIYTRSSAYIPDPPAGLSSSYEDFSGRFSEDGGLYIGTAVDPGSPERHRVFRWTGADGSALISIFPAYQQVSASAISADGGIIVGTYGNDGGPYRAYRWTAGTGAVDLGYPTGVTGGNVFADRVSRDGSVVAGTANGQGFVWTEATGGRLLPMAAGAETVVPGAISSTGEFLAGWEKDGTLFSDPSDLVLWSNFGQSVTKIGKVEVNGSMVSPYAAAISADGKRVFGSAGPWNNPYLRAFSWTQAGGFELFPESMSFLGASASGNVFVLEDRSAFGDIILFNATGRIGSLTGIIAAAGYDLTGMSSWLSGGFTFSADGDVLSGLGYYDDGGSNSGWSPWKVSGLNSLVAAVPEPGPGSYAVVALGVMGAVREWRRHRARGHRAFPPGA